MTQENDVISFIVIIDIDRLRIDLDGVWCLYNWSIGFRYDLRVFLTNCDGYQFIMELSPKSIYAYEKVQSAIRDHENDVSIDITAPKPRAKVVVVGVGKTSLIYRQRYGSRLGPFTSTIGASFIECEM
ncbi:hypothetical protein DICVIV_04143 [Dictyocaulus viviparus]|uniref:Uncharacterized protein n=1 Tax=Dictyocaulus viviparus TaxID=29172 RepID=A0A0D8Y0R7_DICVI|nr:hypothetical protein DICVIV_04143 [Dictyocaulus viviparus]